MSHLKSLYLTQASSPKAQTTEKKAKPPTNKIIQEEINELDANLNVTNIKNKDVTDFIQKKAELINSLSLI